MPGEGVGEGRLWDLYPEGGGIRLWFWREGDPPCSLWTPYAPTFYLRAPRAWWIRARHRPPLQGISLQAREVLRRDLLEDRWVPVWEVRVGDTHRYAQVLRALERWGEGRITLYTCDIPLAQRYLWDTALYPLAPCVWEADAQGVLRALEVQGDPWDEVPPLPAFRTLEIRREGPLPPHHRSWGRLEVVWEGETHLLEGENPRDLIQTLAHLLTRADPDILLTRWGDGWLLPHMEALSRRVGIPLPWHRSPGASWRRQRGVTYHAYGQIYRREEGWFLAGRWHLDQENSFLLKECGLEGLLEAARLGRLPVQPLARATPGTVITALQLYQAHREGILIPREKAQVEAFRPATELLEADKGGLVFLPRPGLYEGVAELDFAALYPSIMVRYNISPETLDCPCCPEHRVPQSRHHTCHQREGFIPRVLRPVLERRARYKARLREEALEPGMRRVLEARQTALKWMLVVCFGYMGYRNARFGRIEAHEAVTAWARELLLQAKEVAEAQGWEVIHAVVDALWVTRPGITEEAAGALAQAITHHTGLPILVEGIYRWIWFPPSRLRPSLGVPNRYVGVFRDGRIKVRGLEMRRQDTPPWIARVQEEVLRLLAEAPDGAALQERLPQVQALLEQRLQDLWEGRVDPTDLAFAHRLSRSPSRYRRAWAPALAAQALQERGVALGPGHTVQWLLTDPKDPDPRRRLRPLALSLEARDYDRKAYETLLRRALEPLLQALEGACLSF